MADLTEIYDFPGAPDKGALALKLDPAKVEVCYELKVRETDQPRATHIHRSSGEGPASLELNPRIGRPGQTRGGPNDGRGGYAVARQCEAADIALVASLLAHPGAYYIDVHTDTAPDGAIGRHLRPI
ncbi:MAG: CHRD domain-containing protein [Acidimicrobiales bacterium]